MSDYIEGARAEVKRRGWKGWTVQATTTWKGGDTQPTTAWKRSRSGALITIKGDSRDVLRTMSLLEGAGL